MICPKCETEFHEKYAKFCTECGTALIKNRSLDEIPFNNIENDLSKLDKIPRNVDLSKLDVIIDQNDRIIELLEDLNKSSF